MAEDVTHEVQGRARIRAGSAIGLVGMLAVITLAVAVIAVLAAGVLSPARPQFVLDNGWRDYGLRHAPAPTAPATYDDYGIRHAPPAVDGD
jgi:hypothetical protein